MQLAVVVGNEDLRCAMASFYSVLKSLLFDVVIDENHQLVGPAE